MSDRALYYPYIHIQDENWLKGTLLMFSQVRRMVPARFTPSDTPEIKAYAEYSLLESADLWSPRAQQAQRGVAGRLHGDAEDDPAFQERFGRQATQALKKPGQLGFQIHQQKLVPELQEVLKEKGLAWDPDTPEPYDKHAEYVELHPHVGEVVMSTLAIACAEGEGLDIVGDRRSARLHRSLIEKDSNAVYDSWLHPSLMPEKPMAPTSVDLFEFLLGFRCDLSELKPHSLAEMGRDREPLKKLVGRLRNATADMSPSDPGGPDQQRDFRDIAADVLREWEADRRNMCHYWRVFFGEGITAPGEKFLEKAAETLLEGGEKAAVGAATGAATHAVAGAAAGGMMVSSLIGAGAGLAIGILVHAGKAYYRMGREEKESPYRYLTLMESAGVVFGSDLGGPPRLLG